MNGAFLQASTAANAAKYAVIVAGIIHKLVHKPLTETFFLRGTVGAMGHHGKVRIHAAVPATETAYFPTVIKVLNIIALTGRTDKCTGSATQAALGKLSPHITVKQFKELFAFKSRKIQGVQRELLKNLSGLFLNRLNSLFFAL